MLSQALYRWGRLAARHPWQVIGAWLLLVVVVLAASSAVGKKLEDSFAVPGTDSEQATELLTTTASAKAGLTMQLVLTPKNHRRHAPTLPPMPRPPWPPRVPCRRRRRCRTWSAPALPHCRRTAGSR